MEGFDRAASTQNQWMEPIPAWTECRAIATRFIVTYFGDAVAQQHCD
jgi:hypothetical protein